MRPQMRHRRAVKVGLLAVMSGIARRHGDDPRCKRTAPCDGHSAIGRSFAQGRHPAPERNVEQPQPSLQRLIGLAPGMLFQQLLRLWQFKPEKGAPRCIVTAGKAQASSDPRVERLQPQTVV